jgi:ABC transport system ATP-binding/permease protein
MAESPIFYLKNAVAGFGGKELFTNLNMQISKGEKICLIGKNGCGKSTLLKIIKGQQELDKGEIYYQPALKIGYLQQDSIYENFTSVYDFVLSSVNITSPNENNKYLAEKYLTHLGLRGNKPVNQLSGGKLRRASLAKTLLEEPDLLLLDEPTNHLDIDSIEWLQQFIRSFKGAVLCISHDRAFLRNITAKTFWLTNHMLLVNSKGYSDFDRWSEEISRQEDDKLRQMNQKLVAENLWLQQGVTARRKRNQKRLSDLISLRKTLRTENEQIKQKYATINLPQLTKDKASKLVFEAENIGVKFFDVTPPKIVINDFSIRILQGEKIGIIGRNGAGKSTLLKLLTKQLQPTSGHIKFGNKLNISYFDQQRQNLDATKTLWETLCPGGGDMIKVGETHKHIASYLKDFLFDQSQLNLPITALSGGEANRLLLAKILASAGSTLILDEPTNDLDMDSLDMLEELLADYTGTLIIVSHDREFLNSLVTRTLIFDGNGNITDYYGTYDEFQDEQKINKQINKSSEKKSEKIQKPSKILKISYKDKREFELLPDLITKTEQRISFLETELNNNELYIKNPEIYVKYSQELEKQKDQLHDYEIRFIELDDLLNPQS